MPKDWWQCKVTQLSKDLTLKKKIGSMKGNCKNWEQMRRKYESHCE